MSVMRTMQAKVSKKTKADRLLCIEHMHIGMKENMKNGKNSESHTCNVQLIYIVVQKG